MVTALTLAVTDLVCLCYPRLKMKMATSVRERQETRGGNRNESTRTFKIPDEFLIFSE